ncbi:MAG: cupin domain-containing protein [Cryobacterium sp.]|nr:cupin domain-containing protein [Cryobacterium sp.]
MSAPLIGTREPGVMFTYAFFIPAGVFDAPHSHIADAHLLVAFGELRLAYGTSFNEDDTTAYAAGSFLWVPAGAVHFDGANVDTILIGTATGPWNTAYIAAV